KPIELTKRLLLSAMPKDGGLVLVPFVGSGSECYVAKQLGFDFIGYELNPEYAVLAEGFIAGTATSK
nr:DNA methyltransferase [Candidatus Saccharibacteria bacterium]